MNSRGRDRQTRKEFATMNIIPPTVYTLYQYTNRLNGKCYIGVTNDTSRRFAEHARGKSNARAFNAAVKKYGTEVFDYKVLAVFDDASIAAYHEQAAILKFGTLSPDGYNLRAGAPFTQYNGSMAAESRAKIGLANSQRIITPESRAKIGIAHKGNRHLLGHIHSAETRAKMVAAHKGSRGYTHSIEARAKISAAAKGRILNAETRAKIGAALKGHVNWNKGKMKKQSKQLKLFKEVQ
jgi:group I intron endonuclease